MREPVERTLAMLLQYEPGLGNNARTDGYRYILTEAAITTGTCPFLEKPLALTD